MMLQSAFLFASFQIFIIIIKYLELKTKRKVLLLLLLLLLLLNLFFLEETSLSFYVFMIYLLLLVCFLPYKNQTLILKNRNVTDFKNTRNVSDAVCNALLINLIPSYTYIYIYIYLPLSRGILLTVIGSYNLQPIPIS